MGAESVARPLGRKAAGSAADIATSRRREPPTPPPRSALLQAQAQNPPLCVEVDNSSPSGGRCGGQALALASPSVPWDDEQLPRAKSHSSGAFPSPHGLGSWSRSPGASPVSSGWASSGFGSPVTFGVSGSPARPGAVRCRSVNAQGAHASDRPPHCSSMHGGGTILRGGGRSRAPGRNSGYSSEEGPQSPTGSGSLGSIKDGSSAIGSSSSTWAWFFS